MRESEHAFVASGTDMFFAYHSLMISKIRASLREGGQPTSGSFIQKQIAQGAPYFPTVAKGLKAAPISTVKALNYNASNYYVFGYAPLIFLEFGVHGYLTDRYHLNEWQGSMISGFFGGIVATPGDNFLIRYDLLKKQNPNNASIKLFLNSVKIARGFFPTIGREMIFTGFTLSGIQSLFAKHYAKVLFAQEEPNLPCHAASILTCLPFFALTEPFNRVASVMQREELGLKQALSELYHYAKGEVKPTDPLYKQTLTFLQKMLFAGGLMRAVSLSTTLGVYAFMKNAYKLEEGNDLPEMGSSKPDSTGGLAASVSERVTWGLSSSFFPSQAQNNPPEVRVSDEADILLDDNSLYSRSLF